MEKERPLFEEELGERTRRTFLILEILRRRGPLSRAEISKVSGINPVTVSSYLDKLISQNIVYEKELDTSSGGRPPMLLDINPSAGYSLGIGINLFNSMGLITDLEGKVLYKYKQEKSLTSPDQILEGVISITEELLNCSSRIKTKIKGIGLGIGGIVDKKGGLIRWPQRQDHELFYSYISVPIKKYLEERFSLPVFIENDANLACFAEYWLCLEPEIKNLLYMFSGVGVGMMINGELYTGQDGCAGEIFINLLEKDSSYLGDYSFFRQWKADLELVERTRRILGEEANNKINNLEDAFFWAKKDKRVKSLVRESARALGIKVALLVNLLNPQVVIIGGGLEKGGFDFIEEVYSQVKKYAFDAMTKNLKIIPSSLGDEAVSLGAANLVVRNIFTCV
ncbi:MAG TPA: ROK family transcriptional regulator [Candidatus Omnitrophica bacterium]|nr:MAG: hypothetical protein DRP61_02830 [Candidatus Omnitrophota bacterium]RKY34249.1 MAG: hypothetical protein DRP69_05155 [Candidatus Omnitrophota bacterium]RKY44173.1 MAG: hypothetical protein DRP80_02995 [Candidatus Omnitrophota bacterium]HEC69048.1 ROK family transcriptional regulator [Candidatus Omnitrophota bacterium]